MMNTQFQHKKSNIVVRYIEPIEFISDAFAYDSLRSYVPEHEWFVKLHRKDQDKYFVMPLLEFLNTYEPITRPIDNLFNAIKNNIELENSTDILEKVAEIQSPVGKESNGVYEVINNGQDSIPVGGVADMDKEIKKKNERDKEDICTLHSGESEVDPTTTLE